MTTIFQPVRPIVATMTAKPAEGKDAMDALLQDAKALSAMAKRLDAQEDMRRAGDYADTLGTFAPILNLDDSFFVAWRGSAERNVDSKQPSEYMAKVISFCDRISRDRGPTARGLKMAMLREAINASTADVVARARVLGKAGSVIPASPKDWDKARTTAQALLAQSKARGDNRAQTVIDMSTSPELMYQAAEFIRSADTRYSRLRSCIFLALVKDVIDTMPDDVKGSSWSDVCAAAMAAHTKYHSEHKTDATSRGVVEAVIAAAKTKAESFYVVKEKPAKSPAEIQNSARDAIARALPKLLDEDQTAAVKRYLKRTYGISFDAKDEPVEQLANIPAPPKARKPRTPKVLPDDDATKTASVVDDVAKMLEDETSLV